MVEHKDLKTIPLPERVLRVAQVITLFGTSTLGILVERASTVFADQCRYVNGFAKVVAQNPQIPACINDEHFNSDTGKVQQDTVNGGKLEWDSRTNTIIFTSNGQTQIADTSDLLRPTSPLTTSSSTDRQCKIENSFKSLATARPDIIGRCLESTHSDPNNPDNTIQQTTKGMLWLIRGSTYFNNGNATYLLVGRKIYERKDQEKCPEEPGAQVSTPCREVPLVVNHIYTQENVVALTGDDGASREAIKAMSEAILATGNRATFFINGRYYQEYKDLILELDQTGSIYFANHTFSHADLKKLAEAGAWDQVRQEVTKGDPRYYIPNLKHFSPSFRFPGFSDNAELRRMVVFDYGLTVYDSDQGNFDYTSLSQSYVDSRIINASPGQIAYWHFLPRNTATFRSVLTQLNQRGIRGEDLDHMLDQSLTRTIFP